MPVMSAPMNPASRVTAIAPPTKPGARPGRSASPYAMKPDSTAIMKPIAAWPIANSTAPMYRPNPARESASAPAVPAVTISPSSAQISPGS